MLQLKTYVCIDNIETYLVCIFKLFMQVCIYIYTYRCIYMHLYLYIYLSYAIGRVQIFFTYALLF